MSLININQVYLDELTAEIADAEKQQIRLADYLVGLRALHDGIKIFLEKKNGFADGDAASLFDARNFLDKSEPQTIPSSNEISPDTDLSADIPGFGFEEVSGGTPYLPEALPATEHSNSLESELSDKELLKGLPMFEALKKYLSISSDKQTVSVIIIGLAEYGFKAEVKHPYESVRGMLRYYEKRGIFERNGATWGLTKKSKTEPAVETESEESEKLQIGTPGKSATSEELSIEQVIVEDKPSATRDKTNTQYCKEILQKSEHSWLHVDQILDCLKNDYGIVRSKKIISAALRKNSNNTRRVFKAIGRNRFALLEEQPATAKSVSA